MAPPQLRRWPTTAGAPSHRYVAKYYVQTAMPISMPIDELTILKPWTGFIVSRFSIKHALQAELRQQGRHRWRRTSVRRSSPSFTSPFERSRLHIDLLVLVKITTSISGLFPQVGLGKMDNQDLFTDAHHQLMRNDESHGLNS